MGAKSAVKLRNRGVAYKCDICGRKLMSDKDLVSHKRTAHNVVTKRQRKPQEVLKVPKPAKTPAKEDIKEHSEEENVSTSESADTMASLKKVKRSVEFECPKCLNRFATYFPALKHIQKYHCVDKKNSKVPPNRIQPVRIDLCTKCMCKVRSIQTHVCEVPKRADDVVNRYTCSVCEEPFPNIKIFDQHVVSTHCDTLESMFFPTSNKFLSWKTDMEKQMGVSYVVLDQWHSNKKFYHCNYGMSTRKICPSLLVTQEFPKGIQVNFYHTHGEHTSTQYKMLPKYKKYFITMFFRSREEYNSLEHLTPDDSDLYMQFKTLMEGIIVDAAKINITTLKVILGKALEITSILTNYDEESEDIGVSTSTSQSNQILTDLEIAKSLEEAPRTIVDPKTILSNSNNNLLDVNLAKRKGLVITDQEIKRPKIDVGDDLKLVKIVNSYSLADVQTNHAPKIENPKGPDTKQHADETKPADDDTPSSFNDSYKDFVVKNFPSVESVASRTRSKPILKTRIGEFKHNVKGHEKTKSVTIMADSPKLDTNISRTVDKTTSDTNNIAKTDIATSDANIATGVNNRHHRAEIKSIYQNEPNLTKSDYNLAKVKSDNKMNPVPRINVNTRTKCSILTEVAEASLIPEEEIKMENSDGGNEESKAQAIKRLSSFDKPKVDFEYEVKEQADDCNILILKMF